MLSTVFKKILLVSFVFSSVGLLAATEKKIFTSKQCLNAKFDISIEHKGKFFGLVKNKLTIKKEKCIITISKKEIFKKEWIIDICREPIHIKTSDKGSVQVHKRGKGCDDGNYTKGYCEQFETILTALQDDGLIFASGDKEDLTSQHGQNFCSYLLIKKHLKLGKLFSVYNDNIDIFAGESLKASSSNCDVKKPVQLEVVQEKEEVEIEKSDEESADSF
jgi:hypothetical protein